MWPYDIGIHRIIMHMIHLVSPHIYGIRRSPSVIYSIMAVGLIHYCQRQVALDLELAAASCQSAGNMPPDSQQQVERSPITWQTRANLRCHRHRNIPKDVVCDIMARTPSLPLHAVQQLKPSLNACEKASGLLAHVLLCVLDQLLNLM